MTPMRPTASAARCSGAILALLVLVITPFRANAVSITGTLTELGGNDYLVDYTIENTGEVALIEQFSLLFDAALFGGISDAAIAAADGWSGITFGPEPLLGFNDLVVDYLIDSGATGLGVGDLLSGFSVAFTWLGSGDSPISQPFEIIDPATFATLFSGEVAFVAGGSGDVPVPVSAPSALMLTWAALLLFARRFSTISSGFYKQTLSRPAATGQNRRQRAASLHRIANRLLRPQMLALLAATLLVPASGVFAQTAPTMAPFSQFEQVSQTRVGRTTFEFVYRAAVIGGDTNFDEVMVTVTSTSAATVIVDGSLSFGSVAAGETVAASDTFSIRHNLRAPFNPGALVFDISATETPPGPLELDTVISENNQIAEVLTAEGGTLALLTGDNATINVVVPEFAILESTEFSAAEITDVVGFAADARVIAAARLGPAGQVFANAVNVEFDISGLRRPGTMLVGFIAEEDGSNVRLVPVRPLNPNESLLDAARDGISVSVATFGFSDVGIVELTEGSAESQLEASREASNSLDRDALERLFELLFDASLPDPSNDFDTEIREIISERRLELLTLMNEFINRDELTVDMQSEFTNLTLTTIGVVDLATRLGSTSPINEQLRETVIRLGETYTAGLHLQCFANPTGIDSVLASTTTTLLLRAASQPDADTQLSLDQLSRVAEIFSECFALPALEAYFENLDVDGDILQGMVTGRFLERSLGILFESESLPDIQAVASFLGPTLESREPLRVRFADAGMTLSVGPPDSPSYTFGPGSADGVRSSDFALSSSNQRSSMSSPGERELGERPIVTTRSTFTASGTVEMTPRRLSFLLPYERIERNDSLRRPLFQVETGTISVGVDFTPRDFAEQLDLEVGDVSP
ncbi:MAG: hypothetical protein AAF270_15160 [Pseudomonadota bacterium]